MLDDLLKTFDLTRQDGVMILVWIGVFLAICKLLEQYFFAPYLALIEAREKATEGAKDEAHKVAAQAQELSKQYEAKLFEHKVKVMSRRNELLGAARTEANQIVDQAEKQAQSEVLAARKELAQKIAAISAGAPKQAAELADFLVKRVGA